MSDYKNVHIYRNPKDNRAYASYHIMNQDRPSFKEIDAWPIYDFNTALSNIEAVRLAKHDILDEEGRNPFIVSDFEDLAATYKHDVIAGGDVRMASLRSEANRAVDIVNVWQQVLGRREREFAGKNMAFEIGVDKLLISIDTFNQFGGMVRIDEQGQNGMLKEMTYSRSTFTAQKYGLKFKVTEESQLRNVHNIVSDGTTVAGYKLDQRASFDVIAALGGLTTIAAAGLWDTYEAGADRSVNNPRVDIAKAALQIQGTGVGGKVTRIGAHPITVAAAMSANTHLKGLIQPSGGTKFEPGTIPLPWDLGLGEGVGLVQDNAFRQGYVYLVDNQVEPSVGYFQGPQRMGAIKEEMSGDSTYYIVDYHLAAVIRAATGKIITGVSTPLAW